MNISELADLCEVAMLMLCWCLVSDHMQAFVKNSHFIFIYVLIGTTNNNRVLSLFRCKKKKEFSVSVNVKANIVNWFLLKWNTCLNQVFDGHGIRYYHRLLTYLMLVANVAIIGGAIANVTIDSAHRGVFVQPSEWPVSTAHDLTMASWPSASVWDMFRAIRMAISTKSPPIWWVMAVKFMLLT